MSDLFGNHIVGFPTRWLILRQQNPCSNQMVSQYLEALPVATNSSSISLGPSGLGPIVIMDISTIQLAYYLNLDTKSAIIYQVIYTNNPVQLQKLFFKF